MVYVVCIEIVLSTKKYTLNESLLKMEILTILQFVILDPVSSKLQTNLSENYKLHKSLLKDNQKMDITQ